MRKLAVLLLVAMLVIPFIPAIDALSPVTFTDKSTFTSLNSGRWFQVWTNSTGYSYFVDINQGNFKSVILDQYGNTTSTATATLSSSTNPSAVSAIEVVAGVPRVYTAQQQSTTLLEVNIVNLKTAAVISSANMTISATQAITGSPIAVAQTKNAVYYMAQGTGAGQQVGFHYSNRDLTGFTTITNTYATGHNSGHLVKMIAATNGASAAADVIYALDASNNNVAPGLTQITTAGASDLGNVGAAAATTTLDLTDLEDKAVFRFIQSSTTKTFTITKATDAISAELYDDTWLTYAVQPFDFDGTTFTYSEDKNAYFATATQAIAWQADGVFDIGAAVMPAESLEASTGIISGPDATYYKISNSLIVEGSGTTWTPRLVNGTPETIAPTPYAETLDVPLAEDSTIFADDVLRAVCDANYHVKNPYLVSDDSDCTLWRVVATSSDTLGRTLTYEADRDLVHANPLVGYTMELSAAEPSLYYLTTMYDSKAVDSGNFDSGGTLTQSLLEGQCYVIQIEEALSGNVLQTGTLCANDVLVKPISLSGITIPADWLGNTWSHSITRYFNGSEITPPNPAVNSTHNSVLFTFQKNVSPYNATVNVVDNIFDTPTLNQTFTYTDVSGISVLNMTGYSINSNQTLYFTVSENGDVVLNAVSAAQSFDFSDVFAPSYWGLLFGVPAAFVFPFLTAVLFPKTLAYFGTVVTMAIIGIMQVFGFITLPIWFWGICTPLVALAVVVGARR